MSAAFGLRERSAGSTAGDLHAGIAIPSRADVDPRVERARSAVKLRRSERGSAATAATPPASGRERPALAGGREQLALAALLAVAAAQYAWNAWTVPPLTGYDAPGHAAYALTVVETGRLPHPLSGWSTFHPPLWYLLAAGVWKLLDPLGPHAVVAGLRAIGAAAWLGAGAVAFYLARRLGVSPAAALVGTALVLFVPVAELSAVMEGNEALAAALAAGALPALVALQRDPGARRAAVAAGLFAGLALATKFTALFVAAACAVPFLRSGLGPRGRSALALALLAGGLAAGPTYLRNLALLGTPFPMTRTRDPMRAVEASFEVRPRRLADYVSVDPAVLLRPTLYHLPPGPPPSPPLNPAMTSVPGLTYAGAWYDALGHRLPFRVLRQGSPAGPLLLLLGLPPTLLALAGALGATREAVRRRLRSPDAPLVVMSLVGVATYLAFTWNAPSLAAAKASYLLPLAVPAAAFFGRALDALPRGLRGTALALSATAAVAAALVFTQGLLFPARPLGRPELEAWRSYAAQLPGAHIAEALDALVGR